MTAPLHGSLADASLRAFVARVVGWTDTTAIEHALRSVDLATNHRAALVLAGDRDITPIAAALHRRTLGPSAPFVTVNPRRLNADASIRSPANRQHGVDAVPVVRRALGRPTDSGAIGGRELVGHGPDAPLGPGGAATELRDLGPLSPAWRASPSAARGRAVRHPSPERRPVGSRRR